MKTLLIDEMDLNDLKELLKALLLTSTMADERLTALQDRVLKLEMKLID